MHFLWKQTLNSVPFGICLMALIGAYIAVGSGLPEVREYFEMDEMKFFTSLPFIALLVLLVLTLSTVTLTRIPFTPPRYGVWCVHAGIITLVYGMFIHYWQKVEGHILVPVKTSATSFYDRWERALYFRAGTKTSMPVKLGDLPRFKPYPAPELDRSKLKSLRPVFMMMSRTDEVRAPEARSLRDQLGLAGDVRIDVIGYHPYAEVKTSFESDHSSKDGRVGVRLFSMEKGSEDQTWLVGEDAGHAQVSLGGTTFQHIHAPNDKDAAKIVEAAGKLHRIDILVGSEALTLYVEPGKSYKVGESGYEITIENYLPNWRTMQGETVDLLTFMVQSPTMKFRRQVIPGRPNPTDWKLDDASAGPMGKRQEKPLDTSFRTMYTFADEYGLLTGGGAGGGATRTIVTSGDSKAATEIIASATQTAEVKQFAEGKGEIDLVQMPPRGPFQPKLTAEELAALPRVAIGFERRDNVRRVDQVVDVPKAKRDRNEGEAGVRQVVTLRILLDSGWSKTVHVPFIEYPAERFANWGEMEPIALPGANQPLQIALSTTLLPLPAQVSLEKFELVPYPGGDKVNGIMRDFRATLRITDFDSGEENVDVAHMNHPVYFERKREWLVPNESWLFFQRGWNPQAGENLSILGVGNRPGVGTMTIGSIMIGMGLLYAFYLKPIVVARMKHRAIAAAAASGITNGDGPKHSKSKDRRETVEV